MRAVSEGSQPALYMTLFILMIEVDRLGYNLIEVNHLISFVTSLEMDMEVVVLPDAQAIAERAADAIEAVLVAKPNAVLGPATGSSPLPL